MSNDAPSKPHPLTERVTREESENDGDCAVGAERPRGYYHRSDGKVVDQDGEVVGSWSWVPPGSPDALTPEEEIAYAVESARIHHQQGGLDGLETRRFILDCLPEGYRIRNDGEIAADDPSLPPVPYLGDLQWDL